MATKQVKGVFVPRHDVEVNWNKATGFIPSKGEIIVYDPDDKCDYARIRIGDGVHKVKDLPFFIAESPTNDDSEAVTAQWVKEYVAANTADIVYLNTREYVGERIELPDVYPVQHSDSVLSVVSKNRLTYTIPDEDIENGHTKSGVLIKVYNSDGNYLKVTGKLTSTLSNYMYKFGEVDLDEIPGKYTICSSNEGTFGSNKQCYVGYTLLDKDGNEVQPFTQLRTKSVTIDSKELNGSKIEFKLFLNGTTNVSFDNENEQSFKIQVEFGDRVGAYTEPMLPENLSGKSIKIYGRNLFSPDEVYLGKISDATHTEFPALNNSFKINGRQFKIMDYTMPNSKTTGMHYYKSIMTEDNIITVNNDNNLDSYLIKTPLLQGDEFTMIFNVPSVEYNMFGEAATIVDVQVVMGHTDYEEYQPLLEDTVVSGMDGVLDIDVLQYPYSLLSMDTNDTSNNGCAIYVKYDPALSRDWTEKQLSLLHSTAKTNSMLNWKKSIDYSTSSTISNDLGMLYDKFILEFDIHSIGQRSIEIGIINSDGTSTYGTGYIPDEDGKIIVESEFDGFTWRGRVKHIARDIEDNLYKEVSNNIINYEYCEYNPIKGIYVYLWDINRQQLSINSELTLYSKEYSEYKIW